MRKSRNGNAFTVQRLNQESYVQIFQENGTLSIRFVAPFDVPCVFSRHCSGV